MSTHSGSDGDMGMGFKVGSYAMKPNPIAVPIQWLRYSPFDHVLSINEKCFDL